MPIIFTQNSPVIGIWKIEESWQEMLEMIRENENYSRDIDRCVKDKKTDKRKQEWLAIRLLLSRIGGPESFIDYLENGAPVLRNSLYNISISHTTGFAAIILSNKEKPGIDIEYHSGRAYKLREKFLGDKDMEMFDSLPDSSHNSMDTLATLFWCAKETAFKAIQQDEVDFIDHLHILPFTLSDKGEFSLKETKSPIQDVFNIKYQITEDYIITWKE